MTTSQKRGEFTSPDPVTGEHTDKHIHEGILSSVHPTIEAKHRMRSRAKAAAKGAPPHVLDILYGKEQQ